MSSFFDMLNQAGAAFWGFSWAMLFQSSVLIAVVYGLDLLIRTKTRAVVRYGVWMLVLVKLVLPPTLSARTGIGYWVSVPAPAIETQVVESKPEPFAPKEGQARSVIGEPSGREETRLQPSALAPVVTKAEPAIGVPLNIEKVTTLTWQAWVLCAWVVGVIAILGLLVRRLLFVQRLLARSRLADASWEALMCGCAEQIGIRRPIEVRVSRTLHSPAACGLMNPVILVPESIEHTLSQDKLRAILLHELVHIKRCDLWVNLAQTLLQVVYFYSPLLWLANATIRGLREKAVDEVVLTKLGRAEAGQYSATLIDMAEIAFTRPHFSLGLIGVVESKRALTQRIKHILGRPMPKSAKMGLFGSGAIVVVACLLLPMAQRDASIDGGAFLPSLPSHHQERDTRRFSFPDKVIPRNVLSERSGTVLQQIRRFEQARDRVDNPTGILLEDRIEECLPVFTDLSRMSDVFPLNLYAQRWLIILEWAAARVDAIQAAGQMNALAEIQSDVTQSNLTRAYAAVVLARDGHMDRAHDIFVTCAPDETPQWGWFVFEMNKYLNNTVRERAPHVGRTVNGTGTQITRTRTQWQLIERPLREAQMAYADYLEYELLPGFIKVLESRRSRQYTEIECIQCVGVLRTLWMQGLSSFSLGATTKAIENRVRVRIRPKILAIWHASLQLLELNDARQMASEVDGHRQEIKAFCEKAGLSADALPMWLEQISTDADNVASDVKTAWGESHKMPRVARVNLAIHEVSRKEMRIINRLVKQLKREDETEWNMAAEALAAIGPKAAEPLTELFKQGGTDVKALNILKPMAASEHVQAVMRSILEYNRALHSNAGHCALIVLAESGNQAHVPMIIRLLQEGLGSDEEPTMEAMALGQLGGEEAYKALCETIVGDISPSLRWTMAEALVKFNTQDAIQFLETASDALEASDMDRGARRRVNRCIYTLAGGALNSLNEFTMPVYDRNVPNFKQYIGGNLSRFDTDYVNLKPYGLEVGASPEALFNQHDQCAFYMKAGHEFVCVRGTYIAPITLPAVDPTQNWGWTDRLGLVYPRQIANQVTAYQGKHIEKSSILLEEGGLYGIVTPENVLLVMRVSQFGQYETGAEATTLTFLKLADGMETQVQTPQVPDSRPRALNPGLNIYLLEDESLTWDDCNETPLEELVLRPEPWIRSSDILRYDTSTHCMTLKQARPLPLERVSLRGNPFVVTVGDKRCYLGAVWTHLSSYLPMGVTPMIYSPDFTTPPNVVDIELTRCLREGQTAEDVRDDARVTAVLKREGVSHAGLSMTMGPMRIVSDANQSSVTYTYTLTNRDRDSLYVFDPDKMGTALFHCFHNAPFLLSPQGPRRIENENNVTFDRDLYNQYRKDWFTLIEPGASLTRSVVAEGYPVIPPGSYEYGFAFSSPGTGFTEAKQAQFDAPVWIGQIFNRDTVTVPAKQRAKPDPPSVWITLLVKSPIASFRDYAHRFATTPAPQPPLYKPVPWPTCDFEIRRADNQQRVARVSYAASFRSHELTSSAMRRIGELAQGDYVVALCIGDQRCSNVAQVTLGQVKDPGSLSLVPLPLAPGQTQPVIGIRAVGPDPQDQDMTNQDMAFPMLLVDGIERQPRERTWMGLVGPLQSGRVYIRLLDLNRFTPPIEPGKQHIVKAIVKRYESEPVVIPADDTLGRAWDTATDSYDAFIKETL